MALIERFFGRRQEPVGDEALRREVASIHKSRRILYLQFTDPAAYPPIEHSSRLLADRGWEVLILGASTRGESALRLPNHPSIRVKNIRRARGGWSQKLQYMSFFVVTLYWTWWWRPEWIYASDPFACPFVLWVQKFVGVRVVYHEHDSPDLDQPSTWLMRQVFACRGKLALKADLCVLPQQDRLQRFLNTTRRIKPAYCVWNCPRSDEMADVNSDYNHYPHDADNDKLIIHYHGNIGSALLPRELVLAASRFKGAIRIRVVGYETLGNVGYTAELIRLAAKYGASEMIEPLSARSRRNLLRLASKAHLGLSLMPKKSGNINMQHMVGASNKAFDYLACGLPLLVADLPDWVETFVKPGHGLACDPGDPDSIERALRWFLEHPEERREMGRRGREKVRNSWNYEAMFAGVLKRLEDA